MKKNRVTSAFWFAFIIVIMIVMYVVFIQMIQQTIPTYQKSIREIQIPQSDNFLQINDKEMDSFLEELMQEKKTEKLSKTEIETWLADETIDKIKRYMMGLSLDQSQEEKYVSIKNGVKIQDTDFGTIYILYQTTADNVNKIVFTQDKKNLYFVNVGYSVNSAAIDDLILPKNEITDKETMTKRLDTLLKQMNILQDTSLTPTSIYAREYDIANTYYIEDKNQVLAIIYNASQDQILRFTLGFHIES